MTIQPDDFRGRLFPAMPTPVDLEGRLHREGLARLVAWVAGRGIGGVSAGGPIGRGTPLRPGERAELLRAWREGLGPDRWLVVPAGAPASVRRPDELLEAARADAQEAASLGADALMAISPGAFRGRPDRDRLVLDYHAELAGSGLPLLVSYRRESSGGIAYAPEILAQLLARPSTLGVEIATLDGIATFQEVAALVHEQAPSKVVVSGEERFLGYSLMCGADSALVGLGALDPDQTMEMIGAHDGGDARRFLGLSKALDALARPIFRAPTEGTTFRLLRALVDAGVLPPDAANDPGVSRPG